MENKMQIDEKKELLLTTKKLSILYAEDEHAVRESTAALLDNFFANVYTASNGAEALEIYRSKKDIISLVITDILMPHLDGIAFAKEVLGLNKNQKIIVISAYNESKYFIELLNLGGISGFLQKPLKRQELFHVLRRIYMQTPLNEGSDCIEIREGFVWNPLDEKLLQNGKEISLTANEQSLLKLFLQYQGQIFSAIYIHTYIYNDEKAFSEDSVKSLLKRLRKKLPKNIIHTKKSVGYFFE